VCAPEATVSPMQSTHRERVQALLDQAAADHGTLVAQLPANLQASLPVDAQGVTRAIDLLAVAAGLDADARRALQRPHAVNPAVLHARVYGRAPLTRETVIGSFVEGARVRADALAALADEIGGEPAWPARPGAADRAPAPGPHRGRRCRAGAASHLRGARARGVAARRTTRLALNGSTRPLAPPSLAVRRRWAGRSRPRRPLERESYESRRRIVPNDGELLRESRSNSPPFARERDPGPAADVPPGALRPLTTARLGASIVAFAATQTGGQGGDSALTEISRADTT
jgi:hypothetical protein